MPNCNGNYSSQQSAQTGHESKAFYATSFIDAYLQFDFCDQNCYHISLQVAEFLNVSSKEKCVFVRISVLNTFAKIKGLNEIHPKQLRKWVLEMDAGK